MACTWSRRCERRNDLQESLMKHPPLRYSGWLAISVGLMLLAGIVFLSSFSEPGKVEVNADALSMFAPLPDEMASSDNPVTDAKVKLGRMLYYDPRLSANQRISCNTCHPLAAYGAEHEPVSTGFHGQKGSRN